MSNNRLACFEPQEKTWKSESGQSFNLANLLGQQSDIIAPLHGLANFNASTISYGGSYPHTLFRLPLRTQSSGLSENVYTIQRLQELLDALREEAKFLLLFLKSVNKIEVIHVSPTGQHSLSFRVEIAPANKVAICSHRESFMKQLQTAHKQQPYRISNVISFTARFSVIVTDQNPRNNKAGTSEWLVANCAGSADASVHTAAQKQKIFPWVGAALELGTSSAGGRIFCFLPMPVEASSGLPIHVNGTFGLNDERRTLKWPGAERRSDPTADWNKIVVSKLLPHCYAMLLCEAKKHLSHQQFYKAWPEVNVAKRTQFMEILQPLFASLFSEAVVRTERTEALQQVGEWILLTQATFISEGSNLASVVCRALSNCGVKLATIPSNIWAAIRHNRVGVTEVNPQLTRAKLRSYSQSYTSIDPIGKKELLRYCLSDRYYQDLSGLYLLPLANNSFTNFDNLFGAQLVYLCTSDCPRSLLPNLDHMLVDLIDDTGLNSSLYEVASSQETKLRILTESEVAKLLPQAMPSDWQRRSLVDSAHLPPTWFEKFWKWLQNRNLQLFHNQLIIPVCQSTQQNSRSFYITRLSTQSAVVYIGSYVSCSSSMLSALYKMNLVVCQQSEFSFVHHRQLAGYVKQFDTNGVLDAIAHQPANSSVVFSSEEADSFRNFLMSSTYTPNQHRRTVLQNLCIFSSAANSSGKLYSFSTGSTQSLARRALGEPANSVLSVANLPSNLVLFSRSNYHQLQLLQSLQVTFPTDTRLLLDHIFPLIQGRSFPDHLMDGLMTEVIDMFQVLNSKDYSLALTIQILPFLKTVSGGRRSPKELFDPYNNNVKALYDGEDVFPLAPFNTAQRLLVLRSCGLQTSVSPQQVLDIISSISAAASPQPQCVSSTRFSRAKAVLEYISTSEFRRQPSGTYKTPYGGKRSFSSALLTLATKRSWLPVLSSCPPEYTEQLSWKGSDVSCHFVSLTASVVVVSQLNSQTLPCLVGSQMYIVNPPVHLTVAKWLSTDLSVIVQHLVAHFREILACKEQLSVDEMDTLVNRVYSYLNDNASYSRQLYSIQEWIFIKKQNKFVSPAVVALQQNQTFRQNLEPYVYILPDTLSRYTNLFSSSSGVSRSVSKSQILSVLKMIRDDAQAFYPRSNAQEAWNTVMSILNWLTNNGTNNASVVGGEEVLVPVESESVWPKLKEASEVVYTDNDFLKTFLQDSEERDSYIFVHDQINSRLAKSLGVEPLSEFLDISEDTFEDAGQHEPLTVRLKNILRDYKDGLTIVKELLQNADDAEATEVNICYDARQHEVNPKKLFFSGMAEAHGPALIVHNNKPFTDEDFVNITKLAAATKQAKALKIGKFGVGFCSVYHMTDAPSFISRDRLYVFDPTLSYLRKEIKNPAQPGKKIGFTNKIIAKSSQLSPYDGLFGFNRSSSYEGTMFRLPFRTSASELSCKCYSEATVQELITAIQESSSSLLLFLQNVKCITFQRINPGETSPSVFLRVTRDSVPMPVALPAGVEVRRLSCSQTSSGLTSDSKWLVSSQSESNRQGKYYTASVACPLRQTDNPSCFKIEPSFQGEIFCFLPLSQKTGLPVHVSSNFAVINNRRGIWTSDDATSQSDTEVMWNILLMQGVIPKAYHALLVALKQMKTEEVLQDYLFHCLWPLKENLEQHNPWSIMIPKLYQKISSDELFYSTYQCQWLHLSASKFLHTGILCQSSDKSATPSCVLEVVQHLDLPIVDLPTEYHTYFQLEQVTIDESGFTQLFFNNLKSLGAILKTRSEVIQHMLEVYTAEYDDGTPRSYRLDGYFKTYPCIPCTPDGTVLRQCTEVVDPSARFARLFEPIESRFPIEELANRHLSWTALRGLGMHSETIPMSMLVERAQTVSELFKLDKTKALSRVELILSSTTKRTTEQKGSTDHVSLSSVPFLPVLPKRDGYHLVWKGEGCELKCGKELMIVGSKGRYGKQDNVNVDLAGSQVAFVNELTIKEGGCNYINRESVNLLGLRSTPTCEEVIEHLKKVIQLFLSQQTTPALVESTDRICRRVYDYLSRLLDIESKIKAKSNTQVVHLPILRTLKDIPCVWTGEAFVKIEVVAEQWKRKGPYLYPVPPSLSSHKALKKALKIKEEFCLVDVQKALVKMKKDFGDQPVDEHCQVFLKELVSLLLKLDHKEFQQCTIMLPDEKFVLHKSEELVYNDVDWAPKDQKYMYVNDIISPVLAKKLHVKPARSNILNKYSSQLDTHFLGDPFGQHEELTRRIQNILRDYPFDITVLKELLQNADDAKATKMYVILDKRTHGKQGILSENWEQLQGPALLIWNDSTFSEKDLKGIQELGLGSKRSDSESIGQYGIGFNVVYHLTDCPSFITGGETMCILDPHCRYVDGANPIKPGRRFDNLSSGFWDDFPQMKSAYLQGGLENCPSELHGGSLFRFPLRHTIQHMRQSEVVQRDRHGSPVDEPLTAANMHHNLYFFAPKMKEAMLFLNHITELRFIVIEENKNTLSTMNYYRSKVDPSTHESLEQLRGKLSTFNKVRGNSSCVIRYPLTISEVHYNTENTTDERWFIQQGVGDIENEQQTWSFVDTVKPRHGIAAPIQLPPKPKRHVAQLHGSALTYEREQFVGQVFCFLPLPVQSKLPVHINGHFILDSNRRHLWRSTDSEREDDRTVWNKRIFEAIASSYANLLEHAQSVYVTSSRYMSWYSAKEAIHHYYDIFPTGTLDKRYLALADNVYAKLVAHNSSVFAVISDEPSTEAIDAAKSGTTLKVDWHPPKSASPSTQIYFWRTTSMAASDEERKQVKPILESIGMKLTAAPVMFQDYFNKVIKVEGDKLQHTTPKTVFDYYIRFCCQVTPTRQFPCALTDTIFKEFDVFRRFTEYLLQQDLKPHPTGLPVSITSQSASQETTILYFPSQPFGHPLLLTADGQLRKFKENGKVLKSSFSHLFPKCLNKFLHPKMLRIRYSDGYFVNCSPLSNNSYSLRLVNEILSSHLPRELRTTRVHLYEQYLPRKTLVNYWKCLSKDSTFSFHRSELLKQWALLPARGSTLHSYNDKLVPVIPPSQGGMDFPLPDPIYQVLVDLGMPFLDISIVSGALLSCPRLSDHKAILKALFHLNQEKDFSAVLNRKRVVIVLTYLSEIDFRNDSECLRYVKSLPLFECIDGSFSSLQGKTAYVWPNDASTIAYAKWAHCHPNTIFIKTGKWTLLGSAEQLQIGTISAEEVYCNYIFGAFSNIDEQERYQHLAHIKDCMFTMSNYYKKNKCKNDVKMRAIRFIQGLENLPCLGKDGGPLRPVKDYCNHNLDIFTTFGKHFRFVPDLFKTNEETWKEWLEFFKEIGLRQTVSQDEFLDFCEETAGGHHENPVQASQVLLLHLISDSAKEAGWHLNQRFLQRVAAIAFIPTEPLQDLTWIRQKVVLPNSLVVDGKCLSLAKLREATIHDNCVLLWTVKPVVKLRGYYPTIYPEHLALLSCMSVTCKPQVVDVISNIRNICASTKFTSFELFDQYPGENRQPNGGKGLMEVMISLFQFLQSEQENLTNGDRAVLKDTPCIPVYSTTDITHRWQVVLVKPCSVLNCHVTVTCYHPFLRKLPFELNCVASFLEEIGVRSVVDFSHIQFVLETAFVCSAGQELEGKTTSCVFTALKKLITLLSGSPQESKAVTPKDYYKNIAKALTPLYLPTRDRKLALSTNLLYVDDHSFKGKLNPKLEGTGYSMLSVQSSHPLILMYERDFCHLLPKEIRPRGLSEMCTQTILDECKCVKDSEVAISLKETLGMTVILPKAIAACVRHFTKDSSSTESIEAGVLEFLSNFEVITFNNLRMVITFKETAQLLGNLDTMFFLKVDDLGQDVPTSRCLYLNSKLDKKLHFNPLLRALSRQLLLVVRKSMSIGNDIYQELDREFLSILVAQNPDVVRGILEVSEIPLEAGGMDDLSFKLGKLVPECWHHRLDQTIENVFHPGETVGYEVMDDHIIIAEIMHPVLPEGVESFDSVPRVSMRYRIFTSPEDEEGIEVSVLRLYKFLKGLKKEKPVNEDEKDLVPYEGETEPVRLQQQLRREDLEDIKSKLLKQLDDVWKLPQDERDRAIRRLYLKWHPDKNPDNPDIAEQVFKFLVSEVEKRKGKIDRVQLDKTASRQKKDSSQSGGGAEPFGGTGWGGPSPGMPPFPEENLQPEINAEEGRRWVKQAEVNFRSLVVLHSSSRNDPKLCADVCFMAHQVAEKALKGGKYYVCGLGEKALKSHNLTTHAYGLQQERPGETHGLASHTAPLEVYYLDPRYPNRWPCPTIPADQYTSQQADEAKNHAEIILNIIKNIVE